MTDEKKDALSLRRDEGFKLGLEPGDIGQAMTLAETVASTGMFGIKSPQDALVRLMTGRSLGLPAMVALQKIHVIEGKPGLEADLILALVLAHPACEYFECVETSAEKATYRIKRKGREEQRYTFTIEDAKAALLLDRGDTPEKKAMSNWNRWRPQMLRARCVTNLAKMVIPEASMGLPSREELADERDVARTVTIDAETGAVLDAPKVPLKPARDFAKEADALISEIEAVETKEQKTAVRKKIEVCDIPPVQLARVEEKYNTVFIRGWKPKEATPAETPATPTGAA